MIHKAFMWESVLCIFCCCNISTIKQSVLNIIITKYMYLEVVLNIFVINAVN